jgi:hypothetical protein
MLARVIAPARNSVRRPLAAASAACALRDVLPRGAPVALLFERRGSHTRRCVSSWPSRWRVGAGA